MYIKIIVVNKRIAILMKTFLVTSLNLYRLINHAVWGWYNAHTIINDDWRIRTNIENY